MLHFHPPFSVLVAIHAKLLSGARQLRIFLKSSGSDHHFLCKLDNRSDPGGGPSFSDLTRQVVTMSMDHEGSPWASDSSKKTIVFDVPRDNIEAGLSFVLCLLLTSTNHTKQDLAL